MTTLSEQMKQLAAAHDLTCISIHLHIGADSGRTFYTAYAHAAGNECAQGDAGDPEAALASAISKINARRTPSVTVPALVAAA